MWRNGLSLSQSRGKLVRIIWCAKNICHLDTSWCVTYRLCPVIIWFFFDSCCVAYSQVHKYWDIDTIQIFLALYTTMDFK